MLNSVCRLASLYFKLLGCKLGDGVLLESVDIAEPDMISIGAHSVVNDKVILKGYHVIHKDGGHHILVDSVTLGGSCCVLPGALLEPGTNVADNQTVQAMAVKDTATEHNKYTDQHKCAWVHSLVDSAAMYLMIAVASGAAYPAFRLASWMLNYFEVYPWSALQAFDAPALHESNFAFMLLCFFVLLPPWYGPFVFLFTRVGATTVTTIVDGAAFTLTLDSIDWLETFVMDVFTKEFHVFGVLWIMAVVMIAYQWCTLLSTVLLKWLVVFRTSCDGEFTACSYWGIRKLLFERLYQWTYSRCLMDRALPPLFLRACGAVVGNPVSMPPGFGKIVDPDLVTIGDSVHMPAFLFTSLWVSPTKLVFGKVQIDDMALAGGLSILLPGTTLLKASGIGFFSCTQFSQQCKEGLMYSGRPAFAVNRIEAAPHQVSALTRMAEAFSPLVGAFSSYLLNSLATYPALILSTMVVAAQGGYDLATALLPIWFLCSSVSTLIISSLTAYLHGRLKGGDSFGLWDAERSIQHLFFPFISSDQFVKDWVAGTEMFSWACRIQGASIGRNTTIFPGCVLEPELCQIGEDTIMEEHSLLHPGIFMYGRIRVEPVNVGSSCHIGCKAHLVCGGQLSDMAHLATFQVNAGTVGRR